MKKTTDDQPIDETTIPNGEVAEVVDSEAQPELEQLREKINQLETQVAEATNQWKRALADYQNLVKRTQEEKKDFFAFAVKSFVEKLLPVIDDLEMASAHVKDPGLALALKKLFSLFKEEGLERIDTNGKEFDIHSMEAINLVETDTDNQVVQEHRAGYTMHGSVLRPAQVTVSKKSNKQ